MLLVDTGVILGLLNSADDWHQRCVDLSRSPQWEPLVPTTVLVEVDYMLRKYFRPGWKGFFEDVKDGLYVIEVVNSLDCARAIDLCMQYPTMQFCDATVIAIAERKRMATVATTDRRDFCLVTPKHCQAFNLVP